MRTVHYSSGKLLAGAIAAMIGIALGVICLDGHGKVYGAALLLLALCPVLLFGMVKALMGDRNALSWDERWLEVTTLWRHRKFRWSEVSWVGTTVVTSRAFFGLIKTGQSESLTIKVGDGVFSARKYNLARTFLDLTEQQFRELVADLALARGGIVEAARPYRDSAAEPVAAPAYALTPAQADDSGDFDPDTALARYLAKKQQAEATAGPAPAQAAPAPRLNGRPLGGPVLAGRPAAGGFGRKGL
ncbi:MAG: hypothetical protein HOO94_11645 [Novosphingobium sp.]|nr:hypothetical protein [Novosphingobium sp.]